MTRDWRESLYPLTSFRVDYQTWNCQQLADEVGLLKDALAVASEQRAGDTAAHLRAETEAVHTARTLKKCNSGSAVEFTNGKQPGVKLRILRP